MELDDCPSGPQLGVCFADAASGQVLVGQFRDDEPRSQLRTHLTALQPVEVSEPSLFMLVVRYYKGS